MGKTSRPRRGSLQFWPRKRASKRLHRVNWDFIKGVEKPGFLGFIAYKAGMSSAFVRDNTPHSMTSKKRIIIPVTILECPKMKIFSIRFYNKKNIVREVLNGNLDKELKRKLKLPKKEINTKKEIEKELEYDNVRVLVYNLVKNIGIKKKPEIAEIGLSGNKEEKINFIKENLNKEISVGEVFENELVDFRGVTTGRGTQGPVKRFGIKLRFHKSEKGVRKVGSIGPWHPARVSFRVPMAGQTGFFSRVVYNGKILRISNAEEQPLKEIIGYGKLKGDYIIVNGSVQGPKKREIMITKALRATKKQKKINYDILELR